METLTLQGTHSAGVCAFPRTVQKLDKAHIETSVAKKKLGEHITAINNYAHALRAGRSPSNQKVVALLGRLLPYVDHVVSNVERSTQLYALLREILEYHELRGIDRKYTDAIERLEGVFLDEAGMTNVTQLFELNRKINAVGFVDCDYQDGYVSRRAKALALIPKNCIVAVIPWA